MNRYLLQTIKKIWNNRYYKSKYSKKIYLKWKEYNRVYNDHWNKQFNIDYFRSWNWWDIEWRYVDESKIFTAWDLYYIKQNNVNTTK